MQDLAKISGSVAIIAAAGAGKRMQSDIPKQYLKIKGRTVLGLTLDPFLENDEIELVVLVVASDDEDFESLSNVTHEKIVVIEGGKERIDSVLNALNFLFDHDLADSVPILIHDAARPCVTQSDIEKLLTEFKTHRTACFLASPLVDSLHQIDTAKYVSSSLDRNHFVKALTPQMAQFSDIREALKKVLNNAHSVTDDVSALRYAGYSVRVVTGREDNIKITHPSDLALAEFFLKQQQRL